MPAKLTESQVQNKIKKVHGDTVCIIPETFKNTSKKVVFIDKDFGTFESRPYQIFEGKGHPKRGVLKRAASMTIPISVVIERLKMVHGEIVKLDTKTYKGINKTKARFIDKDFGEWWAIPSSVLAGQGHKKRGRIKSSLSKTMTMKQLKKRIFAAHGNIIMIDESTYKNTLIKALFIDKDFGEWWTTPHRIIQGRGHPRRGSLKAGVSNSMDINIVKQKLIEVHGSRVIIDENTYKSLSKKARFVDIDYGEWWAHPKNILNGHGHMSRRYEKMKLTCLANFGVDHPQKSKEISLQTARTQNKITDIPYWKDGSLIPCQASYEIKSVERWNQEREEFVWQIIFQIPKDEPIIGGKTYRIDAYLPNKDLYIEIKGYFRGDAKLKWDWFHKTYPNSELWDEQKLIELGII